MAARALTQYIARASLAIRVMTVCQRGVQHVGACGVV